MGGRDSSFPFPHLRQSCGSLVNTSSRVKHHRIMAAEQVVYNSSEKNFHFRMNEKGAK